MHDIVEKPAWRNLARRSLVVAVLAVAAGAQEVNAQAGGGGTARPEYRVTRFDENWSALRDLPERSVIDQLKYIPLTDSGTSYLSVGGQYRYRAESVRHFLLVEGPERTDGFGLSRALLHVDAHFGPHLRAFVEGKHAVAHGRELPGGRRPLDHDEWAVQNAFVEVRCCGTGNSASSLRVGRQELLLGTQKLVSPLDWSNTRRTFEGAQARSTVGPLSLQAFWVRPVVVRVDERNTVDRETSFSGIVFAPAGPPRKTAWELYAFRLEQGDSTRLWGHIGDHERLTVGGRLGRDLPLGLRAEVEGGWQGGELAGNDVSAWFFASDLRRAFPSTWSKPALSIGFDYASGDGDPADGKVGTFHQLFPLGHAYAGFMDLLGRQNLVEGRAVFTAAPLARAQTRLSVHHFARASAEDAVYNVGGGVLRAPAGVPDRSIGSEINVVAGYRLGRHTRLEAGYGHFFPGSFMKNTPAGATGSDWLYASTSLTF